MSQPSREYLKALAYAPLRNSSQSRLEDPVEMSGEEDQPKRPFTSRPLPKAAFAALLTSPALLFGFMFMSGTKMPSQSSLSGSIVPPATAKELEDLKEQLEAATVQLNDAEAKLAVVKQEKAPPPILVKDTDTEAPGKVSRKSVKPAPPTRTPVIAQAPIVRSQSVAPPPRAIAPRPAPQPVRPSAPTQVAQAKAVPIIEKQEPSPSVYGSGPLPQEREDTQVLQARATTNSIPEAVEVAYDLTAEEELISETDSSELEGSDLETPLLEEQPLALLKAGTSVRTTLITPYVKELQPGVENAYYSLRLNEPLYGEEENEILPQGSIVLVQAAPSPSNLVNFVAVEAVTYEEVPQQITLPEGALGFRTIKGGPVLAQPLESSDQLGETLGTVLGGVEQALELKRLTSDDNLLENLLSGRGTAESLIGELREVVSPRRQEQSSQQQMMFLPAGTELELYVSQDFSVSVPASPLPAKPVNQATPIPAPPPSGFYREVRLGEDELDLEEIEESLPGHSSIEIFKFFE